MKEVKSKELSPKGIRKVAKFVVHLSSGTGVFNVAITVWFWCDGRLSGEEMKEKLEVR